MSNIPAQQPPGDDGWTREIARYVNTSDSIETHAELRLAALEEVLAARWPGRVLVRRRLARAIRRGNRNFPRETFALSRFEATMNDWLYFGWRGGPAVGGPLIREGARVAGGER